MAFGLWVWFFSFSFSFSFPFLFFFFSFYFFLFFLPLLPSPCSLFPWLLTIHLGGFPFWCFRCLHKVVGRVAAFSFQLFIQHLSSFVLSGFNRHFDISFFVVYLRPFLFLLLSAFLFFYFSLLISPLLYLFNTADGQEEDCWHACLQRAH